jgi:sec-independent protein translocase protein TatB
MFDIGFSEIVVIGAVALIVVGPERLPKVARTVGILFGRMQRYVNDVKADIGREIELEELRQLQNDVHEAARSMETAVNRGINDTQQALTQTIAPALDALHGNEPALPPAPETAAAPSAPVAGAIEHVNHPTADSTPPGSDPHHSPSHE